MRYALVLLVGLLVGGAATLTAMNSLRKADAYPHGVMAVLAAQMGAMGGSVKQNRCATADLLPRLQTLRALGNDLEPAFLPIGDDDRFSEHASAMRAALDAALAAPPADCAAAKVTLDRIGSACQACHRDFKS